MDERAETFAQRASDGVSLHVHAFSPPPTTGDGPAILMLHGIASHAGWYLKIGAELAAAGAAVFLVDRRGSGRSQGTRGHVASWRRLVRDVLELSTEVQRRHPRRRQHLLGISLGAVIALATTLGVPTTFDSQVLMSPGLAAARRVSFRERVGLVRNGLFRPEQLYELPFTVDQLTDDPEWRARYLEDELRTQKVSARFLIELFRMQRHVLARLHELEVPAYAMLAGADTVVDNQVTDIALARARHTAMRIETFVGASHNLMLSLPSGLMIERLKAWYFDDALRRATTLTRMVTEPST
jgi:acylglycerol lipase